MKILQLEIENFRGIKKAELNFSSNIVLVGDNNSGKSTIVEAIDLVLGPERMYKKPVVNEHDFYAGQYLIDDEQTIDINIEVILIDFTKEQQAYFWEHIEWWDTSQNKFIDSPPANQTDSSNVIEAVRVSFRGYYDVEEDDFSGVTYYTCTLDTEGNYTRFSTKDKRLCGFLYLRTLRTGSRALSLGHGSLLDIILRIKEIRPKMWENILTQLFDVSVATNPELGIGEILTSVQNAVRELIPIECADAPQMKVSQMTRENLRQILTVFLGTGTLNSDGREYTAPYYYQGTGTINALVLALLSVIAELKHNVIFAMEEPEIGLAPHTQKRVIDSVISKSSQAIFTSHSPYVLEKFLPKDIMVIHRDDEQLIGQSATYPPTVKPKSYREEVKRRFCEALLSRRVLITEGRTEYDAITALSNRLSELNPEKYKTLEALGIAMINAETDSQILPLVEYFKNLNKIVYAIYDKQSYEVGIKYKKTW